ncbi:Auxin-responsive protein [Actinidia chinensis var. chinensis]|uniref:Auxin-responsive protein n=1 Tax=Actinidia chinensis var. chinensis TaxID=1590841 RepID=A0A2R6Q266_ACTCC|nr:Auxin-responsive protein [Actinidia chinensis var. chinensis]
MISPKKLIKMARIRQKFTTYTRTTRISFPGDKMDAYAGSCSNSSLVADKGHFVVYTADQTLFMISLVYLNNETIRELFKLSEKEIGLPSDGPITLPCDIFFVECVISLIQHSVAKGSMKALLVTVNLSFGLYSSSSFHQGKANQQLLDY